MTNKCPTPAPFIQEVWVSQYGIEPRGNCLFYGEQQLTNFRVDHATALCSLEDPESVEAIQLQVHPSDAPIHSVVLDLKKGSLPRSRAGPLLPPSGLGPATLRKRGNRASNTADGSQCPDRPNCLWFHVAQRPPVRDHEARIFHLSCPFCSGHAELRQDRVGDSPVSAIR